MIKAIKDKIRSVLFGDVTVGSFNEINRHKWIELQLKNILPGLTILDAGSGQQPYKKHCDHLKYISQDFAQYTPENSAGLQATEWEYAKTDIVSDIAKIPLQNGAVDAILCSEVFEHISNPIEAVAEFSRLLKSNGTLIITAPFCSLTHFAPYHYYTGFNRYFYEKILVENDFENIEITYNGNYFEYLGQELLRLPSISDKYSKKSANLMQRISIKVVLKMLQGYSNTDSDSNTLLSYGLHVRARKK